MRTKFLIIISVILLFIPQLLWKNYGYFVGGDDSLLHYVYPDQMISGFAKNIAVNNVLSGRGGYEEKLYLLPILYLISFINFITNSSNSIYIFLGLILSSSFLSFFMLMSELTPNFKKNIFIEKIFISILYTFSVHHYLSVMGHKLLVMYIVFLIPFILALFSRAIIKNKPILLIPASVVASIFSVVLMGVPWLLGYIISTIGLLLYLFAQNPKRFLDFSIRFLLLLLGMNVYWVFHFIYSIFSSTSQSGTFNVILTQEFKMKNIDAILSVTTQNSLWEAMIGLFHPNLQKNFNWWSYSIYQNWHSHFIVLNILILFFICLTSFLYKNNSKFRLFPFAVFGWLISLYFFTVNMFGIYGIRVFLFLNKLIPGFSMFRNNFDKFASGFAFAFSLLLFATTVEINQNINIPKKIKTSWLIVLIAFIIATTYPVIKGEFERDNLFSTQNTKVQIKDFDDRFLKFSSKLNVVENKSILWLPLNGASYVIVKDNDRQNNVFAGVSPLLYLSSVNDYSGVYSFNTKESTTILDAIEKQDPVKFGNLLKEIGITHIAINNTISEEIKNSYLYGSNFISKQSLPFINKLLGERVVSVDDAFILYKVKDEYYQEQFYFSENCVVTNFSLISREKYKVKYTSLNEGGGGDCELIFKYPYSKLWVLKDGEREMASNMTDLYQNSWFVKNSSGEIEVFFAPRRYVNLLFIISGSITLLSIVFYIKKIIDKRYE